MSASPESTRTRLIREMARDMNRLRNHTASSREFSQHGKANESTGSSFDPENEAMVSTRHLGGQPQQLPELRDSAKRYRYRQPLEPEFQIDTSAIHRAFPDFSQGLGSTEGSISIELGRGQPFKDNSKDDEYSLMDLGASVQSPHYSTDRAVPSKQRKQRHGFNGPLDAPVNVVNSENVTQISQSTQQVPQAFSSAKDLVQRLNVIHPVSSGKTGRPGVRHQEAHNLTQQSAEVADIPNISELVSGFFEDGTPVFSATSARNEPRDTQNRRKSKLSHVQLASIPTPDDEQAIYISLKLLQEKIASLEASKIEDAALIASLRSENDIMEKERQRVRKTDSALGSTSGSDAGDEAGFGVRKAVIEKSRLESRVNRLEIDLKEAQSKYAISSETVKSISHERDAATNQLGVAYLTTERLKGRVRVLEEENEHLKAQLSSIQGAIHLRKEAFSDHAATGSAVLASRTDTSNGALPPDGQDNMELLDFSLNEAAPPADAATAANRGAAKVPSRKVVTSNYDPKNSVYAKPSVVPAQSRSAKDTTRNRGVRRGAPSQEAPELNTLLRSQSEQIISEHGAVASTKPLGSQRSQKSRIVLENYTESERTNASIKIDPAIQGQLPHGLRATEFRSGSIGIIPNDLTVLSGESGESIDLFPELRGILEEARAAKKNRDRRSVRASAGETNILNDKPRTRNEPNSTLGGKKFSKDHSGQLNAAERTNEGPMGDLTGHSQASSNVRRHSENSLLEQRSRREGFAMEDMTSAYIVPDITIGNAEVQLPSASPRQDVDIHMKSCGICHRILEHGREHYHKQNKTTITRPIPVSERMPSPSPGNEDPTMRPSEAPGLSLARVIKGLNDEIQGLKDRLKVLEHASHLEDPGLSKRQRVEREREITVLRKLKSRKSDQVYYLMNVLEGQKVAGQEMTEEEVEVTLDSIGLHPQVLEQPTKPTDADTALIEDDSFDVGDQEAVIPARPTTSSGVPLKSAMKQPSKHPWDNLEDTDELAWEGIESTEDLTSKSHQSAGFRRRFSATA